MPPAHVALGAALVLAVALVLRLVALDHGLPHVVEPDTYIVQQTAGLDAKGLADRQYAGWKYPHLIATVAALTPGPSLGDRAPEGASIEEHRAMAAGPYLRVRRVVAALSALVGPLTFLLALRFFGLGWAIVAGLAASTTLLGLTFSAQARPHAAVAATIALALLACVRAAERPSIARFALAGLGVGVATSTLHFGAASAAAYVAASVAALSRFPRFRGAKGVGAILIGAALAAGLVAWFYIQAEDGQGARTAPVLKANASEEQSVVPMGEVWLSGHWLPLSLFDGGGWRVAASAFFRFDPALSVLAALGLFGAAVAGVRRRGPVAGWIIAAAAVPTILVLGTYALSYERFYLALGAPFGLVVALGARWLARTHRLGAALALALGITSVYGAARWVALRATRDTHEAAITALRASGAEADRILSVNVLGLPATIEAEARALDRLWVSLPWERYQLNVAVPQEGALDIRFVPYANLGRAVVAEDPTPIARESLAAADAQWALVSLAPLIAGPERRASGFRMVEAFRAALEEAGWTRVETVHGPAEARDRALGFWASFRSVLDAERLGPTIEIWRRG